MVAQQTKSPIRDLPVRQPGESLRSRIFDMAADRILFPLLVAIVLVVAAVISWWEYLAKSPLGPVIYTIAALVACLVAGLKWWNTVKEMRDLKLGRIGEEAVGQYLEEKLRPEGCHVLHDIPGDGFNLDHVVIGPTGIYCIETKTQSKPAKGSPVVKYDGEQVTVDGFAPDRDPIVQVKAGAQWLQGLFERSAGRKYPVKPVVLYPGWYVEGIQDKTEVWVLNEKAFIAFVPNDRAWLSAEDVNLAVFHLKRYVISESARAK